MLLRLFIPLNHYMIDRDRDGLSNVYTYFLYQMINEALRKINVYKNRGSVAGEGGQGTGTRGSQGCRWFLFLLLPDLGFLCLLCGGQRPEEICPNAIRHQLIH